MWLVAPLRFSFAWPLCNPDSFEAGELSICLYFTSPQRPQSESRFLFHDWPYRGYGGYTEQRPNWHSYEIKEVKAATKIKMLVYATGCKIQTFDLFLKETSDVEGGVRVSGAT